MSTRERRQLFSTSAAKRLLLAAKVAAKMRGIVRRGITREKTRGSRHAHSRHLGLIALSHMHVPGKLKSRHLKRKCLLEQKAAVRLILRGGASNVLEPPSFKQDLPRPMPRSMRMPVLK